MVKELWPKGCAQYLTQEPTSLSDPSAHSKSRGLVPVTTPQSIRESPFCQSLVQACPLLLRCCSGHLCCLPASSSPPMRSPQGSQGGLLKADGKTLWITQLFPPRHTHSLLLGNKVQEPYFGDHQCPGPAAFSSCGEPTACPLPSTLCWLGSPGRSENHSPSSGLHLQLELRHGRLQQILLMLPCLLHHDLRCLALPWHAVPGCQERFWAY